MEKEILTKEIAKKLMEIKGEVRGFAFKDDAEFILKEKGEEGLKKLEDELARVGYPIEYKKIKLMNFYPIGMQILNLLAIKKVFNFDDNKFREMGAFESKLPLAVRFFMRYFVSFKTMAKQTSKMWKKYYTAGDLQVSTYNEAERYAILRLKNFRLHPLHCRVLEGYFPNSAKMVVRRPVTCKETKCLFLGNAYHEFLLKW